MGFRDAWILEGLGRANELGRGTTQNDIQALGWYELAAAKGSGEAMYRLGRMREDGRGEPRDYAAAVEWHRKAVEVGYDRSLKDLVRLHAAGGYGLDRDLRKAESWFKATHVNFLPGVEHFERTRFAGLAFILKNAEDYQSGVLDYDETCRALQRRMSRGDDGASDLLAWLYAVNANPNPKMKGAAVNLAEELCRKDGENPRHRNGGEAVRLAEKLCRKDGNKPQWRNTLAAAYARVGKFAEAAEQQEMAIVLLPEDRKASPEGKAYSERLELYRKRKAFPAD